MKLPSVLKQLWHNLQLMDFHAKRESFYLELAASIRFKEQFRVFLVEELLAMPQRSRVLLLNDISGDILTMALRGASAEIKECVLASISPRSRRMIESDLQAGTAGINPREIAIARRAVAQEAIRLANAGQIQLKETEGDTQAA